MASDPYRKVCARVEDQGHTCPRDAAGFPSSWCEACIRRRVELLEADIFRLRQGWFTTSGACRYLGGISRTTLARYRDEEGLPYSQPAREGRFFYNADDLDAWVRGE